MAKTPGTDTITVVRKAKVDRLSDATPTTTPDNDIPGCAVLPRTSNEEGKGWVIVEGRMVIAPYGVDVLATDQIRIDGVTWDVDGEPGDYRKGKKGKATIFYLKRLGT